MPDAASDLTGAGRTVPSLHSSALIATAYAKLNLALHVTGQRNDGYHLLDTLVVFADFGDEIAVKPASCDNFSLTGPYCKSLVSDGTNLVLQARDLLRSHFPETSTPVSITLRKNLPVASGIGGGSSDAAATLILLMQLWDITVAPALLQDICLQLGADVPMCLHGQLQGGGLIARGIGEDLHPLPDLPVLPLVLINDLTTLSTPQIFKNMGKRDNPPMPPLRSYSNPQEMSAFLQSTRNDLFTPAAQLAPQLNQVLKQLRDSGALFTQMSGSGATCFAIYDTVQQAERVARDLRNEHPEWFICASSTVPAKV